MVLRETAVEPGAGVRVVVAFPCSLDPLQPLLETATTSSKGWLAQRQPSVLWFVFLRTGPGSA